MDRNQSIYDDLAGSVMSGYGIGDWRLELGTGKLHWGAVTKEIHEVSPDYEPTLEAALEFYPEDDPEGRPLIQGILERAIINGASWAVVCRLITAKKRLIWVRSVGNVIVGDAGKPEVLEGFFQDVSDYRSVQQEAQDYKKDLLYQQYAVGHHAIVSIADPQGTLLYVNDNFVEVSGYSREELIGANNNKISSGVHDDAFWQRFWGGITNGEVYRTEICNCNKQGGQYWMDSTVVPHLNERGEIDRYISIQTDITEKKRVEMERKKLEHNLLQMQKLEALGLLTGGIAHDFNNMLSVSLGYARLLQRELASHDNSTWKRYIEKIVSSSEREKDLVSKLLAFSRGDKEKNIILSLVDTLNHFKSFIGPVLPKTITLEFQVEGEEIPLFFSETSMSQVLMNLTLNARDAMPTGGVLRFRAELQGCVSPRRCTSCRNYFEGDYVVVSVSDTGTGIPDSILERIFDPFYTTKEREKGSGIGLSIVHGLMHGLQGHICIESSGDGTNVELYFPVVEPYEQVKETSVTDVDVNSLSGKLIAVVDDEASVAEVVSTCLQGLGAKVKIYESSSALINDIKDLECSYDLVVTDMTMPQYTGLDLLKKLRGQQSNIPVIVMTGYSDLVSVANYREKGFEGFLQKPIELADLYSQVVHCIT